MVEYNQNVSLEDNIANIYNYLYMPFLSDDVLETLRLYIEAYNQTLNEYANSESPSESIKDRLRLLSGPINFVKANFPDNANEDDPHPAVDIIKNSVSGFGSRSKEFARVRKPSNIPSTIEPDIDYSQINGFGLSFIIIIATVLLGIGLGSLLFFIK